MYSHLLENSGSKVDPHLVHQYDKIIADSLHEDHQKKIHEHMKNMSEADYWKATARHLEKHKAAIHKEPHLATYHLVGEHLNDALHDDWLGRYGVSRRKKLLLKLARKGALEEQQ